MQCGGCAVVLGALSPRTRNAQVAMYQAGEIDYLVATDAIGMGLNMDLDHVAFSAQRKFDGRRMRQLNAAEMAQIAGRAGRYLRNGTFGTTADLREIDAPTVAAVTEHRFSKIKEIFWRNSDLSFDSLERLKHSLNRPSTVAGLRRLRDGADHLTLLALTRDEEVRARTQTPEMVHLLWKTCQIPDFRKILADSHIRLVRRIFLYLAQSGALPEPWIAERIAGLERCDGDIDTLTTRISHIRTWTYISHHTAWLADARHWQERARAVEDKLSDALHERLTQRFVDRRAAALVQRMRESGSLIAAISEAGEVLIEGHAVGRMVGFRFLPDDSDGESKAISSAAQKVLGGEIGRRVGALEQESDDAFSLDLDAATESSAGVKAGAIFWRGASVAALTASGNGLKPGLQILHAEALNGPQRERVRRRLAAWLERRVARAAEPLLKLREAPLAGAARAIAFQLCEALGCIPREMLEAEIAALDKAERAQLAALDVRLGALSVYCRAMLKNSRSGFAALLWAVKQEKAMPCRGANPAAVGFARDPATPPEAYNAMGFVVLEPRVLRADMAERLIAGLNKRARAGHFAADTALLAIAGCSKKQFPKMAAALGFAVVGIGEDGHEHYQRSPRRSGVERKRNPRSSMADPNSPFAELDKHRLFGAARHRANKNRAIKSGA